MNSVLRKASLDLHAAISYPSRHDVWKNLSTAGYFPGRCLRGRRGRAIGTPVCRMIRHPPAPERTGHRGPNRPQRRLLHRDPARPGNCKSGRQTSSSPATICARAIGRRRPPSSPTTSSNTCNCFSGVSGTACWTVRGDELNAAEALDRDHPMISVLRRRLKVEMQQKKRTPPAGGKWSAAA